MPIPERDSEKCEYREDLRMASRGRFRKRNISVPRAYRVAIGKLTHMCTL